jgi:hypothetical protein
MMKQILTVGLMVSLMTGCGKNEGKSSDELTLEELNRALSVMVMAGKGPTQVSDLTNFPALKGRKLPTPPPGKKLVLDPTTRQVVFADQ